MSDFKYEGDDDEDCVCSRCDDVFEACAGYEPSPDQLCDSCAQEVVTELREELARLAPPASGPFLMPVPADAPPELILGHYQSVLDELARLRAKIGRAEALPAKWRARAKQLRMLRSERHIGIGIAAEGAADMLEAALTEAAGTLEAELNGESRTMLKTRPNLS